MNPVNQRLEDLREVMRREHLAAFIFPSTDPHQGEYVPDHWKGREFISGFNGSAGTAVVTMTSAALWTDSRYFLAAEEQLRGTEYQLMKLKIAGTPSIAEWIGRECGAGAEVGIDGWCSSANAVRELIADLRKEGGITLRTNLDPLRTIWRDRPPIPERPVELFPLEYAGESTRDKLARIRKALRQRHADGMLMSSLDDIAWTLNLRGTDVHCNPVFVSYLLVSSKDAILYINKVKLPQQVAGYLNAEGVAIAPYEDVAKGLKDYFEYNILLDPDEVNYVLFKTVSREIVEEESPVKRMKTVKNEREIAGFRSAMLKDGIAMVKFLYWLSKQLPAPVGEESGVGTVSLTELSISDKLASLRAEQPLYRDISFDTIAGYGEHAAIVHYEPTPETDIPLQPRGLLLLDSGAQYLDGTTDITRTIALGPLTEEERRIYTLVLKGHIQIELCKFPSGSSGTQIDILARKDMWREGLNYLHGTGHGVGTYLNVHEGPHQFRMEWKPAPLVAGMTITDEPGIYLPGRCGARTENTLLIVPYKETEFGEFLQFESLTLCPIDKAPIIREMMLQEEIDWLNQYHQRVFDTLAPHLNQEESAWLQVACAPL
jgi:Xaa-Pro aminopeptidase